MSSLPRRESAPAAVSLGTRRLVPPPSSVRRVLLGLLGSILLFVAIGLASPWQQTVRGTGRVIAYAPLERRQNVEAPVAGRVVEWFVREGSVVAEGDPIVRISDNDPQLMARLAIEREAAAERLRLYEARVQSQRSRLEATARAQDNAVRSYEAQVRASRRAVEASDQAERAAEASYETALLNLARRQALQEQGLASRRQFELAQLAETETRTTRDSARARARGARDSLASKEAELAAGRANRDSYVESARASLQSAQSDQASARAALARMNVSIARQQAQLVTAPRAGVVFRLMANQGGEQVSSGDTLAVLVPDARERAVEVWVDGNDAAIVSPDRPVRLQFEGWPAVQFAGWPSVAVGTFGGRVAFVDSTDDGEGNFRVVLVPDPQDEPWPVQSLLAAGDARERLGSARPSPRRLRAVASAQRVPADHRGSALDRPWSGDWRWQLRRWRLRRRVVWS